MMTPARHKADRIDRADPMARRARPGTPGSPAQAVLDLQRTAGNRAVAGLTGTGLVEHELVTLQVELSDVPPP